MATQYGIFEDGTFNCKYACSKFEARKHCVERAKEKAEGLEKGGYYYEKFNKESHVLVFGEIPSTPGMYIQNAVPDHDCTSFQLINASPTWYSSALTLTPIFTISFSLIHRVDTDPSKFESEIIKTEVGDRKVIRDLNDPRDALLAEIEGLIEKKKIETNSTTPELSSAESSSSKDSNNNDLPSNDEEKKISKN